VPIREQFKAKLRERLARGAGAWIATGLWPSR